MKIELKKINGFTRQPHLLQILSYLIFLFNIINFTLFVLPFYQSAEQIILGIFFYSTALLMAVCGFICTYLDPTDIVVIQEREAQMRKSYFDMTPYDFFCNSCGTHCSNTSKHCKQCERCVSHFDHHCKWLNNCIGGINYKYFVYLIISVLAQSCIYSISAGILIIVKFKKLSQQEIKNMMFVRVDYEQNIEAIYYILIISSILTLVLFILDLNLVVFHFYLHRVGKTTYEYILSQKFEQVGGNNNDRPKSPKIQRFSPFQYCDCCFNGKKLLKVVPSQNEKETQLSQKDSKQNLDIIGSACDNNKFNEEIKQNQEFEIDEEEEYKEQKQNANGEIECQSVIYEVQSENFDNQTDIGKEKPQISNEIHQISNEILLN